MTQLHFASSLVLASAFIAQTASAAPAVGDLLVAERFAGSVVNIAGGGDVSADARFATGLTTPTGLCVGPNGDVYVTEYNAGEVTIITAGGSFASAAPFATGLSGPFGLACDDNRVIVAELDSDEVTDITAGGSFANAAPLASGIESVKALLLDQSGRLWAASGFPGKGIYDITAGGDFAQAQAFAKNQPSHHATGLAERDGALLTTLFGSNEMVDYTAGGNLDAVPVLATYPATYNLLDVGALGLFASDTVGNVYEISAGGDYTSADAYATGIDGAAWGMAYIHGCGDGVVHPGVEACDDAAESASCNADCSAAVCGDGIVNASAGELCDDGNADAGDGCSPSCQPEIPDDGQGGQGGEGQGGQGAGAGGQGPDDDEDDVDAQDVEDAGAADGGCSVSPAPGGAPLSWLALLGLALVGWRRRR